MKQITLPVFAIATLIAGPLMAQGVTAGHQASSAPTARGGSLGCMENAPDTAQNLESRLASLQAKLKITHKQVPQWNTFAAAMRGNERRMTEMHRKMGSASSLSAPERLDRMEKMTTGMMKAVQSTKAAFMPLYHVLTPEQKKAASTIAPSGFGFG